MRPMGPQCWMPETAPRGPTAHSSGMVCCQCGTRLGIVAEPLSPIISSAWTRSVTPGSMGEGMGYPSAVFSAVHTCCIRMWTRDCVNEARLGLETMGSTAARDRHNRFPTDAALRDM